jgi:type IX secretion system PorP/SprF family membrane protein
MRNFVIHFIFTFNLNMMKSISTFLFLATALTSALHIQAQDVRFLQYNAAPMLLNPALTAEHQPNGEYASHVISANYANNWSSLKEQAFSAYAANYAQMIPVGRADYLAMGVSIMGVSAGSLDFTSGNAKLMAAYSHRVGGYRQKSHYVQLGFEGGVVAPRLAGHGTEAVVLPDVGAGVAWQTNLNAKNHFNIGVSAAHLNRANAEFVNNRFEGLYTKFTIHANGEFKLKQKLSLQPAMAYYIQGPVLEFTPGTAFKYNMSENRREHKALSLGVFTRFDNYYTDVMTANAVILTSRFDYGDWALNLSYNINASRLTNIEARSRGFEMGLRYNVDRWHPSSIGVPAF